jgi:hypothetical protein
MCCVPQASLEKKLRAANLQKRNAERSNELSAVMREVRLLHILLAQLLMRNACRSKPARGFTYVHRQTCHILWLYPSQISRTTVPCIVLEALPVDILWTSFCRPSSRSWRKSWRTRWMP